MKTFTDSKNRSIELAVTVGSINRVKSALGINLSHYQQKTPDGGQPLVAALSGLDVCLLVDVLYWVSKPSLDLLGLDQEAFAESLEGDALARAQDAFMGEWSDFFRGLHRTDAVTVIEKGRNLIRKTITAANAKAESMLSDEQQTALVEKAFSSSATGSLGSSVSTRPPSP